MRRQRFLAPIAGLTGVLVLASLVWAHTALERSEPARAAHLAKPPTRIVLQFNEVVDPATSRVALVSPGGDTVQLVARRTADTARRVIEADATGMSVPGEWRVAWRLIGADGHAVTGSFEFHVDSIPEPPPPDAPSVAMTPASQGDATNHVAPGSLAGVASRFLTLVSMVLVCGATALALLVLPRLDLGLPGAAASTHEQVRIRLAGMVRAAVWMLAIVLPVRLVLQGAGLAGSLGAVTVANLQAVLANTMWGNGWVAQVTALILLVVATRGGPTALALHESRWRIVAAAALLLATGAAVMGHAAALTAVAMGFDAVHGLAAGVWAGGVGALAIGVVPPLLALPSEHRVAAVRRALTLFTPVALGAAGILVATGLAAAWWHLRGDLSALLLPGYGGWLAGKLLVITMVMGLGAWHWRVGQPSLGLDQSLVRLGRTVGLEFLLLLVVLALTAVLTGTAPPGTTH